MAKNRSSEKQEELEIPGKLPVLPVRDIVIFPYMILPLFVGREISIKAIDNALASDRMVLLLTQKDLNVESPTPEDMYTFGTVGMIMRMLKLPDGRIKVLVQGLAKAEVIDFLQRDPFYIAHIRTRHEVRVIELTVELEALMRNVKEQMEKLTSMGRGIPPDIMAVIENIDDPGRLADLVASNIGLKSEQAQAALEMIDPEMRLRKISELLNREIELFMVQQKIQTEAKGEIDKTQREYYLKEQLKAIQKELGEIDDRSEEIKEFKEKIKQAKMPEKVEKETEKQVKRLEKMHPDSAESGTIRTYIDWLVELPWSKSTEDNLDLEVAKKVLNEDHYDLEKIKERILEYLGVRKLKERMKGPILCFVGPLVLAKRLWASQLPEL